MIKKMKMLNEERVERRDGDGMAENAASARTHVSVGQMAIEARFPPPFLTRALLSMLLILVHSIPGNHSLPFPSDTLSLGKEEEEKNEPSHTVLTSFKSVP